eukprot:jgi/Hompol1/3166/HPOL_005503-RA
MRYAIVLLSSLIQLSAASPARLMGAVVGKAVDAASIVVPSVTFADASTTADDLPTTTEDNATPTATATDSVSPDTTANDVPTATTAGDSATSTTADTQPSATPSPNPSILDGLVADGSFSTLISLAGQFPSVVAALNSTAGSLTLFAPDDNAFSQFQSSYPDLYAQTNNSAILLGLLSYHVLPTTVFDPATAPATSFLQTSDQNNILEVSVTGGSSVTLGFGLAGTATVSKTIQASNGVIHACR